MEFKRKALAARGFAVVALTTAVLGTGVAAAEAAPNTVTANYSCGSYSFGTHNWTGYCHVYSGLIRSVTICSDSRYNSIGAWIGSRSDAWFVYGDCGPSNVDYHYSPSYQTQG